MEWENPPSPLFQPPNHYQNHHHHQANDDRSGDGNDGAQYVKVMTDEQVEILRIQIAVYAAICDRLVELHESLSAQQHLAGVRMGNLYCDPSVTSVGQKNTVRQRWSPTLVQLQILEHIFDQGTGTPSKQKIKEITAELSQHGQISETNVYNWFQNRRARSKRKQQNMVPCSAVSEFETDVESSMEKKTELENFQSFHPQHTLPPRPDEVYFGSQGITLEMHGADQQANKVNPLFQASDIPKPCESLTQLSFYESMLQNPRIDHLLGNIEVSGSYNLY